MNCKIVALEEFKKDTKKLIKKYRSLKGELQELQQKLCDTPRMGTLITENTYKIRLAVKSKGKGKSGGLRIITHVIEVEVKIEEENASEITIFLVAIYDKSSHSTISTSILKDIISDLHSEFLEEEEE